MKNKKFFLEILIKWNRNENKREMPWKREKDPYKIWISEIILQQTRVNQGLGYYNRFISKWPTVKSLANAEDQEVFKLWEGLGYYSRCKNIIASSKYINDQLKGHFPATYAEILQLKGIGNYTAAAIASFAYNQPYAVVDGNVFRILARFFGVSIPVDTNEGKKFFNSLASDLLDKKNPAEYNQAIMDFGAVICKPAQPLCGVCPFQKKCIAFKNNLIKVLPVKEKKIKQKTRFFNYLVVTQGNKIFVHKRTSKDIWQHLFEFILVETPALFSEEKFLKSPDFTSIFEGRTYTVTKVSNIVSQKLTHQTITGRFYHIQLQKPTKALLQYEPVPVKELSLLPFPKFITSYLKD